MVIPNGREDFIWLLLENGQIQARAKFIGKFQHVF